MTTARTQDNISGETLQVAERLRQLISKWVHTTRTRAGTPSSSQLETLRILHSEGSASIAQLAEHRSVKHQSMRLVLAQLDADGTVRRAADPDDRRSQIITITAKGRARLKAAQKTRALWIAQALKESYPTQDLQPVVFAVDCLEQLLEKASKSKGTRTV